MTDSRTDSKREISVIEGEASRSLDTYDASLQVETEINRPKRIGLTIAFLVFGVFGLWAAFAPIEGAAFAPGTIRVKSYNTIVQHLEGGIVETINVQNGDQVEAGDVLMVMDATQPLAQLEILNGQLLTFTALEARLEAEIHGLESVTYPPLLMEAGTDGQAEMAIQNQVFTTRKNSREGAIAVLRQRIEQLESRLDGLQAMRESKNMLAASFKEELDDFSALLEEGFSDKQRLRDLERNHAAAMGEAADLKANIASTQIQIGETQLEINQIQNEFQKEVANRLAEVKAELKDIRERITANSDIVRRTDIRALISGVVNGLKVHTEGAVIQPGSPILEIVPQSDDLVIEASVSTTDIDRVETGQEATVRLSAFNTQSVPTLHGTVLNISADILQEGENNPPYYLARIALTPESLEALQGFTLVPGMPAEVHINTGSRTFLQYLMKPLSNVVAKGLRED